MKHVVPSLFPTTVVGSLPRPLWLKKPFDGIHEAYAKLHNMVRAAAILRSKHG